MTTVLWISLGVLGGVLALYGLTQFARSTWPRADMGGSPATPLERLGWVGLVVTAMVLVGVVIMIVVVGVDGFHEDPAARFIFWLILMGGIGVWAGAWVILKRRSGGVVVDERDRAILARSFSVESMVVLLSLVAWTVILTEVFWDQGAVPIAYLQLLFWTTFVGGALGRSLGIVLGYRREITVDA